MNTSTWNQIVDEEDVTPEYSAMTLEELSEAFRSARRKQSLESLIEEDAIQDEIYSRFPETVSFFKRGQISGALGDDLTIEEAEGVLAQAEELARLLRPIACVVWGGDKTLKKNIKKRKAMRAKWGKDLPAAPRWKDPSAVSTPDYYYRERRKGQGAKIIKKWAAENGFTVPEKGMLVPQVIDAYVLAHKDKWEDAEVIEHPDGVVIKVWCYQCAKIHQHGDQLGARGYRAHGSRSPHCWVPGAEGYYISDYTPISKWETPEALEADRRMREYQRARTLRLRAEREGN